MCSYRILLTFLSVYDIKPTGHSLWDVQEKQRYDAYGVNSLCLDYTYILNRLQKELERLERNKERRHARERQKGIIHKASLEPDAASPSATPAPMAAEKPTGTTRKCANCGQAGHIKTNKKYCPKSSEFNPQAGRKKSKKRKSKDKSKDNLLQLSQAR